MLSWQTHTTAGLFYTFPLVCGLLEDRYAGCLWHATGYRWYDLYGGPKPVYSGDHFAMRANFADGLAAVGGKALLVSRGKYALIARDERRPLEQSTFYGIPGRYLSGKPTIDGGTLYLSNRVLGTVQAVDISQLERPRLLAEVRLDEHPGPIVVHRKVPVIPAGYQGLLVWEVSFDLTARTILFRCDSRYDLRSPDIQARNAFQGEMPW